MKARGIPVPKDPDPNNCKSAIEYWKKYSDSHSSVIDRLFTGLMSTSVVRKWWSRVSKNFEPFLDLSCDIRSDTLTGCLNNFFHDEKIGDDATFKWEDWKVNTKAILRKRIEKAPQHLVIHLKRFEYPSLKKDRSLIRYKHTIDIGSYLYTSSSDTKQYSLKYHLFGMIIHKGKEMDRGHYIWLFKREDKWYEFDDDKVFEIQGKENTKFVLDKEIYMLLYLRED